ncbi:MAG: hypothetical protein ACRDMJ_11470, partial [Solirubrobacteraceae bacterium]
MLLLAGAALALGAGTSGAVIAAAMPGLTYLTSARNGSHETAWLAGPSGAGRRRLGPATGTMLAPDGQLVAVSDLTFSGQERSSLTLYSSSGAVVASVFKSAAGYQATPVAWSPDSRYLAVNLLATDRSSPYRTGLYTVDATTDAVTPVADGYIYGASFSPTASAPDELVYGLAHSQTYNSAVNLYAAAADGTGTTAHQTHRLVGHHPAERTAAPGSEHHHSGVARQVGGLRDLGTTLVIQRVEQVGRDIEFGGPG